MTDTLNHDTDVTLSGNHVTGDTVSRNPAIIDTVSDVALAELIDQARDYAARSKAPSTIRAYRSDWADFTRWCDEHDRAALPADGETVALYLASLATTHKPSTIARRVAAISQAHQMAGHPTPTTSAAVKAVWSGIRRTHGTKQNGKAPALVENIRAMVAALGNDLAGVRDRALLLVGFAGALRRSELVALDVADLAFTPQGLVLSIRRSKTDQEGSGREVGVPRGQHAATCPVRSMQSWLSIAGIHDGPVFRPIDRHGHMADRRLSDRAVALIVKRTAEDAGLDPTTLSGHSLRAGLATSAAAAGVGEREIMNQTGHRSTVVMRRYIRGGTLFKDNAAGQVGL